MDSPYDRLEGEGPKAWEAFLIYRDAGVRRTIRRASEHVKSHYATLYNWSSKYNWVARSRLWDKEQDQAAQQAELDAIRDMNKRHTEIALLMQQIAHAELIKHAKEAKKKGIKLHPDLVLKLTKEGTALERISRGEAQEIIRTEVKDITDYSMLDIEDLRHLRRIKKKMAEKESAE